MKVIDAHTGLEVKVGSRVPLPISIRHKPGVLFDLDSVPGPEDTLRHAERHGLTNYYTILAIHPGVLRASMDAVFHENGRQSIRRNIPLAVRWTHPSFFLQHVAFVPS